MRALRVSVLTVAAVLVLGVACEDEVISGIPSGVEVFTATPLNGANERPTPVSTTATGTAVITALGNLLSWKIDVTDIDSLTAGHIHRRHPDSTFGGVVVNLSPTATGLDFTGTVANGSLVVHDSVLAMMRAGRAYVNLHTRANPGGEIRAEIVQH